MDIIGAEAAGAGAQAGQSAALGEKQDGGGGLFGLVLARLAGEGETDENEGEGAEPPSTDAVGPVALSALSGLLVPVVPQQTDSPAASVPEAASFTMTDAGVALVIVAAQEQGGASAGLLPDGPRMPEAPLVPVADQTGESPFSLQSLPGESLGPGSSSPLDSRFCGNDAGRSGNDEGARGNGEQIAGVMPTLDSGARPNERASVSNEAGGTVSAEPAFTEAQAGAQHKPSSLTVLDSRFRGNDAGEDGNDAGRSGNDEGARGNGGQSAGVTFTPDSGARRHDGTSQSDETTEAAPGDAVRQPAMDRLPFGSEKLAAETLSAPPPAFSESASASALPKATPSALDPAPAAGGAFQRDMLQIQLPPNDLGRVTMQVSVHARQVQASVTVEHQGLGAYLAAGQGALDDAVRQHGLRVEEFRVDLLDLGAGRTGQGQDSPEFHGGQDALPGRPLPDAVPPSRTGLPPAGEPEDAAALGRISVFA